MIANIQKSRISPFRHDSRGSFQNKRTDSNQPPSSRNQISPLVYKIKESANDESSLRHFIKSGVDYIRSSFSQTRENPPLPGRPPSGLKASRKSMALPYTPVLIEESQEKN